MRKGPKGMGVLSTKEPCIVLSINLQTKWERRRERRAVSAAKLIPTSHQADSTTKGGGVGR